MTHQRHTRVNELLQLVTASQKRPLTAEEALILGKSVRSMGQTITTLNRAKKTAQAQLKRAQAVTDQTGDTPA